MATRMVTSGFKMGASGARKGLGMLAKNPQAMDALGKAGAAGMMKHAQASLGPGNGQEQQQQQQQQQQCQSSYPLILADHTHRRGPLLYPVRVRLMLYSTFTRSPDISCRSTA